MTEAPAFFSSFDGVKRKAPISASVMSKLQVANLADRYREEGRLDLAEKAYSFVARWASRTGSTSRKIRSPTARTRSRSSSRSMRVSLTFRLTQRPKRFWTSDAPGIRVLQRNGLWAGDSTLMLERRCTDSTLFARSLALQPDPRR